MSSLIHLTPPARPETDNSELDRLLHPYRFYDHPTDVLSDAMLTIYEKRAILSSWASDASAVESCPALRSPPFAANTVTFDEVMEALLELDRQYESRCTGDGREAVEAPSGPFA
jgi:hypothetical protein